ncbi:DNA ligase (ATP), partial [Modicella reniformis]
LDRERGRYGLKEQKLADLYISCLNILPGSEAANKLKSWREGMRESAGDFSLVVREVVASRSLVTHPQGQTIREVNQLLAELSKKGSDNVQIFKTLVQSYTALENKWIVRIINRDLKIGMSENTVLPCYHPDAIELFNVCSDLRKTVVDCADPHVRVSTSTVNLNHAFKPMLSKRLPSAKDVVESMGHMAFWIETKLDGERVQVHKDGDNYRYWSRNSTEYTHLYGATPNEGSLTPFIHPLINPKVEKLILDGEMVEYDPATKEIVGFGTVKTAGSDHSDDAHKRRPFLFVFDVLYMNGASIIDQTLETRREMLPSIIPKESEGRLEILAYQAGTTEQHIIEAIDVAVMDRQEGVIIKNPRSTYTPNGRGQDWIKIKPEYVDGVFDSLDVLIVGGYYGSGSRGGQGNISSFICAVRDNASKSQTGKPFVSFCKFGSGFTYQQMSKFGEILGPHWKDYRHYRENPWVEMVDNAKMRPDVIIDPEKSIVVEVKAAEIVPNSDSYGAEYTLRFPRFMHIREDKDWTSCMALSDVHRMFREFKGKLSTRVHGSSTVVIKTKRKPTGPRKTTQAHLLHTIVGDMSTVKVETDVFKGQVFWVVRGDDQQTKSELEVLVKRFGGKQSQSDQMENTIIIAGQNGPDLIGLKRKGYRNIVLPTWVRDCAKEKRLVPLNPKYMMFTTKDTEKQFRLVMDEFDDSFIELLTAEGLQVVLDKMPNRSEVVKRKRLNEAKERATKIKVKRLNNLEDQADPLLDSKDKDAVLQMELDNQDEVWEREDAERARKISATLSRRYYGDEGERAPPLGMFQGVLVFMVYPPTPAEYIQSISKLKDKVKQEYPGATTAKYGVSDHFGTQTDGAGQDSVFDVMSHAIDLWTINRDKDVSRMMEKLNVGSTSSSSARRKSRKVDSEGPNWEYVADEEARQEDLECTLDKLSHYELSRNNLDMVTQILEFHGAEVVPMEQCTIEDCQKLLRKRVGHQQQQQGKKNKRGGQQQQQQHIDNDFDKDVGVPLEIVILFDPLYLDTLKQWKDAMKVSVLYGSGAQTFEVPRLVTSEWVKQSQKSEYRLPEENYYPVA